MTHDNRKNLLRDMKYVRNVLTRKLAKFVSRVKFTIIVNLVKPTTDNFKDEILRK